MNMNTFLICINIQLWSMPVSDWFLLIIGRRSKSNPATEFQKTKPPLLYDDMYLNSTFLNSKISNISFVYNINFMLLVGYINYII